MLGLTAQVIMMMTMMMVVVVVLLWTRPHIYRRLSKSIWSQGLTLTSKPVE